MKIAIQAADLDHSRIDGTRVYILNMLKYFGKIASKDEFFIYHKNEFNPKLTPPNFSNYKIKKIKFPFFWTQTAFATSLMRDKPDVLWMPMHNMPFIRRREMKTVVTIHDLAFKIFPEFFTKKDLKKLNFLADISIRNSDKIIAISNSTKKDILNFYPEISEEKIKVIYHGFDAELFYGEPKKNNEVLDKNNLLGKKYVLYVGAIQPRKNLKTLLRAFEIYKESTNEDTKLVIVGEKAWMWEETIEAFEKSRFKSDIVLTGKVSFDELIVFYKNAQVFVFPELYAGFGIPVLEAMAADVPVIVAKNSSLTEVGGDCVEYFENFDFEELAKKIARIVGNEKIRDKMIKKGRVHVKEFSWEKCARETLDFIKNG